MNDALPHRAVLEAAPTGSLQAYLDRLAQLLEAGAELKFGFFGGRQRPAEEARAIAAEVERLAETAFSHRRGAA